jgi:hypothetical protein
MSGGTTLQPTIRCTLYLAKLQLTICSIFFTLLSPAVQHYNRQLHVLNGIISGETKLKPTFCYALLYLTVLDYNRLSTALQSVWRDYI